MIPIGGERFGGQVPQTRGPREIEDFVGWEFVGLRRGPQRAVSSMGERGPQTRGPREIEDFVGWEMQGREIPGSPGNRGGGVRIFWGGMGCMGAEDPSAIRNQSSRPGYDRAVERSSATRESARLEMPEQMRRDVRLLGEVLGQVIVESGGDDLLADVERLRRAVIAARESAEHDREAVRL